MHRSLLKLMLLCAALAVPAMAIAGTCYLDDPGNGTPLVSPIQAGGTGNDFGASPTLCGHEVHGTSCVLQVNVDSTGSASTDCLTLNSGVTVEMNDHTITCSSATQCGTGINVVTSGNGTSQVVLNSGNIAGCWTIAIKPGQSFTEVNDFQIDCAATGSCASDGDYGIGSASGASARTVNDTSVRNCDNTCYVGSSITTIQDSIAHDCGTGFSCAANGGAATVLDTVLAYRSSDNIKRTDLPGTKCTLRDSKIYAASHCEIANAGGNCTSGSLEFTFSGTNIIGETINH